MGRITVRRPVVRIDTANGGARRRPDTLVVEEPLEIRLGGRPLSVTMRTPGDDFDLVAGFLHGEGIVGGIDDLTEIRYCTRTGNAADERYNTIEVTLAPGVPAPEPDRSFVMTSACGVCGKTSIDSVRQRGRHDIASDDTAFDPAVVAALPEALREAQRVFDSTGGLHAAGLFDAAGAPLAVREDVGRHNAVDKVIGWSLRQRKALYGHVLVVSGRASFELTQKAMMAGIPALIAVSAPSSLAVDLAAESGMMLAGFVRGGAMNVYTGAERILDPLRVSSPPAGRVRHNRWTAAAREA